MKEQGKVKWFDKKKGFGFIERKSGGDVFVHHSDIISNDKFKNLFEGDKVEFVVIDGQKGLKATEVKLLE